jgi:hypothetical protein
MDIGEASVGGGYKNGTVNDDNFYDKQVEWRMLGKASLFDMTGKQHCLRNPDD